MKLFEVTTEDRKQKLLRQVVMHFTKVAPAKFRPYVNKQGKFSYSGFLAQHDEHQGQDNFIDVYSFRPHKSEIAVTVDARGDPEFVGSVRDEIKKWSNVLNSSLGPRQASADLGEPHAN